ncbi:DUF72 domain-containing protein [Winogradskya consettensis]|uniref:DUF72 domain-containing protein n=1 Tax=Winogradskya consettensis TaxID=113560 RepID=UPI0031CEF691
MRLHEGRAQPWPHYGRTALTSWLDRLTGVPTYVYFNNDPGGAAVTDATTMALLARRRGMDVSGTP